MVLGKHNVRVQRAGRAHRRAARQRGGRAGAGLRARRRRSTRRRSTCASPARSRSPTAAFEAMLEGAARSFRQHGFRDVVLLGDHGGYQASLERVAGKLNREWAGRRPAACIALPEYYRAAAGDFVAALKARGLHAARDRHAMPAWPTPRWRWRSTRRWCAPTRWPRPKRARDGVQRRPAPRQRRARAARRRAHRRRARWRRSARRPRGALSSCESGTQDASG